jgi:hypothetical protein
LDEKKENHQGHITTEGKDYLPMLEKNLRVLQLPLILEIEIT